MRILESSVTRNAIFVDGTASWFALSGGNSACRLTHCQLAAAGRKSHNYGDVSQGCLPAGGLVQSKSYLRLDGREATWHGIAQDLDLQRGQPSAPAHSPEGPCLTPGGSYIVIADVSIAGDDVSPGADDVSYAGHGGSRSEADVCVTIAWKDNEGQPMMVGERRSAYWHLGRVSAHPCSWSRLLATFAAPSPLPSKATAYIEGPPPGISLLVSSFLILPLPEVAQSLLALPVKGKMTPEGEEECMLTSASNLSVQGLEAQQLAAPSSNELKDTPSLPSLIVDGHIHPLVNDHLSPLPQHHFSPLINGHFFSGIEGWTTMGDSVALSWTPPASQGSSPPPSPTPLIYGGLDSATRGPPSPPPPLCHLLDGMPIAEMLHSIGPSFPSATHGCLVAQGRGERWQGPAQELSGRLDLFATYAARAWVQLGREGEGRKAGDTAETRKARVGKTWESREVEAVGRPVEAAARGRTAGEALGVWEVDEDRIVNMALSADSEWLNCGSVEASFDGWKCCWGSFRLEKELKKVRLYFQGPPPSVAIWLADVKVEKVDWKGRLAKLQAENRMTQPKPSFHIGSCINYSNFQDPNFRKFFAATFSMAVFENELKWKQNEWAKGHQRFDQAEDMLTWLEGQRISVRGHCLFWDNELPPWVEELDNVKEIEEAVEHRLQSLVPRFRGRFVHYDVNNEMLHGGYFMKRLGVQGIVHMFKMVKALDPSATLFVNDYHVTDGYDAKSRPEKYAAFVRYLLANGAPIDAVGVQGHIFAPVGEHVKHAFDVLATTGLPIWVTELDVESLDDHVRANDLEIVLKEAIYHSAVQGVVLWGFWEGSNGRKGMCRKHSHLVNFDWSLNKAGRRLLEVIEEVKKRSRCQQ